MAGQTALAIFENGMLRLLEPESLDLPEGQPVRLTIEVLDRADYVLALAQQVYAGLSEEQVTEIESVILRPGPWFRWNALNEASRGDVGIADHLVDYYRLHAIYPESFNCPHQEFCRGFAYEKKMTEAKMSQVGSQYGTLYPKIAVVSLDPAAGDNGKFTQPHQRTTSYVSSKLEADDYTLNRPNPHWAVTQIIVKDILTLFGYVAQPNAANVMTTYAGRPIENVSAYFAHVNVTKCSMNNPDRGQAPHKVHMTCGRSYLEGELAILRPDILITQGKAANEIVGELLTGTPLREYDLPTQRTLILDDRSVLWLPMRHPSRQIGKIRQDWPTYVASIQDWMEDVVHADEYVTDVVQRTG